MRYKVFLVDDDRFIRQGLRSLIDWNSCGFEVFAEADNGEDALEFIKEHKPDLVVTDIRMPVLDGIGLIKQTTELEVRSPKFIIVSGYSDFKYAQQAVRFGVHDFILKPIDKDEFETTLRVLFEKMEKEKVQQRNKANTLAIATLEEIISGKDNLSSSKDWLEKLNVKQAGLMSYMLIEVNHMKVDALLIRDTIHQAINQDNTEANNILFREHGHGHFGLLVHTEQLQVANKNLEQFANKLQSDLTEKLEQPVSLFVGKLVEHPKEIKESFESAKVAAQFKYVEEPNRPIFYDKIHDNAVHYIDLDQSYYDRLMEQIEENNVVKIEGTIDQMVQQYKDKSFARDAVKTSINRFVHELVKTVKSFNGDEKDLYTLDSMLELRDHPCTLDQIKVEFYAFTLEVSSLIAKLNKDNLKGNIHKVKKYIDTHFRENLTLKSIANEFYMNPVYMGQLFKKTYGMYFKDYFLQVRINEAKKMLRQTDMRVYEVAESVGFGNADYFVTQFEKTVGVTPTKYRNKVMKQN
ncbi:response regulator [Aquibacillus koreensis]|uniref:Response regulator n=1 Tax=Aquibacillus koreensis TaxID=279446 RepID=A0A9X4AJJ3_9BACI|nr:response regulator [Aquibacillus koreensis]MCT2537029.1 response regulator [Aquibacillus koreensis]MDC3422317.1 response regulator [Aquibacillus koreensis]